MINLIAPYNNTGYGVCGINVLKALYNELGSNLAYETIGGFDGPQLDFLKTLKGVEKSSKNPTFFLFHDFAIERLLEQEGFKALYTFFELRELPKYRVDGLNKLDHIFQPSQWGKKVLLNSGVTVPISVLRAGVDRDIFNEAVPQVEINGVDKDTFVILAAGKWEIRKGYDILLDVFHKAFRKDDDVKLVVNATNPVKIPGFDGLEISKEWENYYTSSPLGLAKKIIVNKNRLDTQEKLAMLMSRADIGVFLSRAEGWNLEATEMLSMGKPVVLSNVTAHEEFGAEGGADMVPFDLLEIALERPFFSGDSLWANPSELNKNYAAELLRVAYNIKKTDGFLPLNTQGINFAKGNTWVHTAKNILTSLKI